LDVIFLDAAPTTEKRGRVKGMLPVTWRNDAIEAGRKQAGSP
jgi:hypothetical protein